MVPLTDNGFFMLLLGKFLHVTFYCVSVIWIVKIHFSLRNYFIRQYILSKWAATCFYLNYTNGLYCLIEHLYWDRYWFYLFMFWEKLFLINKRGFPPDIQKQGSHSKGFIYLLICLFRLWVTGLLVSRLVDLFVGWFLVSLVYWLFAWLPGLLVDWLLGSLDNYFLPFWLAGWLFYSSLVCWLIGRSVGWLVG